MLFSVFKHYLDHYISDTVLKVSRGLCTVSLLLYQGVENCFPRLWGMGISDAILLFVPINHQIISESSDVEILRIEIYSSYKQKVAV